jgi:hypothetical protein
MRWEKTAVYDIEIMHFVGTTVQIQHEKSPGLLQTDRFRSRRKMENIT